MNHDSLTLVMGARSSVGRLVLQALVERGLPVRASTRNLQGATGTVSLYEPDARSAPVHEADVAGLATVALTTHLVVDDDRREHAISRLLTGPAQLSQREQVAAIGRAIGRDLTVVEQHRSGALVRMSQFMPAAEAILMFLDDCAAGNSPATDTARTVLGREPYDFQTWADEHAADFS